jgi:hypothetical protein
MKEWFYVKNDLKEREDIKGIIMRPIWQHFGLLKPKVEIDEATEECRKAFGIVCSFIGTRDLVQEHVAYRIWPLVANWEMPKETISNPHEGGLVRLKYTFRFGDQFIELDDDWLKCVEATSDELLGPYSKAEDNALSAAFRSRKKKRLNRVFDAIGFMYPDYCYPSWGQKRKSATYGKDDASAVPSEPAPKRKKVNRPQCPNLVVRPLRLLKPKNLRLCRKLKSRLQCRRHHQPNQVSHRPLILKRQRSKKTKILEVISPSAEVIVSKAQKDLTTTPKRKRMVNVLDVLEKIKTSSSTPGKTAEASKTRIETKQTEAEAAQSHAETEAGPSEPVKEKSLETRKEETKKRNCRANSV